MWVRHRDTLCQIPVCVDTWPYTSAMLSHVLQGWEPEAGEAPAVRIVQVLDGSEVTVTGSGLSSGDPLFCAEMENRPLPRCRCPELFKDLAPPEAYDGEVAGEPSPSAAGAGDATGAATARSKGPAVGDDPA